MSFELINILSATLLCAFLSTAAAVLITFRMAPVWLNRMVSFSAGLLLTVALLDLLPEALENQNDPKWVFSILLAGLLCFFLFERMLIARHGHTDSHHMSHHMPRPIPLVLAGGAVHIATDGILLAATFLTSTTLGWSMTVAIICHEIPREVGDFGLLLASGWSKTTTLIWNTLSRLACAVGGVLGYFVLDHTQHWIPPVLTLAAASFLYISIAGLLPWLRHERGALWHTGFMAAGVVMGVILPG